MKTVLLLILINNRAIPVLIYIEGENKYVENGFSIFFILDIQSITVIITYQFISDTR